MDKKKSTTILESFISYSFIVFAFLIFVSKSVYQFEFLPSTLACLGILLSTALLFLLFRYSEIIISKINGLIVIIRKTSLIRLVIFLVFVSVVTRVIFLLLNIESINDGMDIHAYAVTSYELSHFGKAIKYADFVNSANYLFWYAVFLIPPSGLFGLSQPAFSIYLTITSTIAYVLLFDTASFVYSKVKAFIAFAIFIITPSQILLVQFVTHEHALMFFLSILVWVYFRIIPVVTKRLTKLIMYAVCFLLIGLCRAVNPGAVLLVPIFLCIFIISAIKNKGIKEIGLCVAKCISLIIVFLLIGNVLRIVQISHCEITKEANASSMWTLYAGANYETSGMYDLDDADAWNNDARAHDYNSKKEYQESLIIERYRELLKQPLKTLKHLINKFNIVWQHFMYSIGYAPDLMGDSSTKAFYFQYLMKPTMLIDYLIFYFLSMILLWSVVKNRKEEKNLMYVFCELYIMGITAMLLLSEMQQRYTITMFPFFYIAAFSLVKRKAQ